MNEGAYRHPHPLPHQGGPPPVQYLQGMPPYHHQQQAPPPLHMPPYGDHYNQMPASRGPPQEHMGAMEGGLAPLAPGIQPAKPEPIPRACVENGRRYELVVIQQPRRARMCGFGDKDRRPITPPPCVRLIITDATTGKEVDCNDIDHAMFVLNVDLWSSDGNSEVNLVRHSTQSPSISNSTHLSYAETRPSMYATIQPQQQQLKNEPGQGPQQGQQQPFNPYPPNGPPQVTPYSQGHPQHPGQYQQQQYSPHEGHPQYPPQNGYQGPPQHQGQPQQQMYPAAALTGAQIHAQGHAGTLPPQPEYNGPQVQQQQQHFRQPNSQTQPQGMFTRNLIGSLAASAFRLTDTDDRIGIWFVLQDLSVRTEGHFRLRFSFVNVGAPTTPTTIPSPPNGSNGINIAAINTGRAPILAACFSEVFTVYSAKKFPGVVESTPLSKCFATQGIKIPIRKDGPGGEKGKKGGDFDDDD